LSSDSGTSSPTRRRPRSRVLQSEETVPDTQNSPALGELSRQVRDVLTRYEGIANKLETNFVTKEFFKLYTDGLARELEHASRAADRQAAAEKERNDQLDKRVSKLESNITWVVRVVIAAIVVAVLAAIGISRSGGGI